MPSTRSVIVTPAERLESASNDYSDGEAQFERRGGIFVDLGEDSLSSLSAAERANKTLSRSALLKHFLANEQHVPLLTIVVNVFGRPSAFGDVLRSLARQSFVKAHPNRVHVLLVQDGPLGVLDDAVRQDVVDALVEFPQDTRREIRAWRLEDVDPNEPRGRGTARNVGIWHASPKTQVIMFLDDAMILDRDFVAEQMLRHAALPGYPMALLGFKENRRFKNLADYEHQRTSVFSDRPNFKQDWKWSKELGNDEATIDGTNGFVYGGKYFASGSHISYMQLTNNLKDLRGAQRIVHRWLPMFFHTGLTSVTYHPVLNVGGFEPHFDVGVWGFEDSYLGLLLVARGVKLIPCPSSVAYKAEFEDEPELRNKIEQIEFHRHTFWELAKSTADNSYNQEKLQAQIEGLYSRNLLRSIRLEIPAARAELSGTHLSERKEIGKETSPDRIAQVRYPVPKLFGADLALSKLLSALRQEGAPSLVSIEALGGLGKTTLAQEVTNTLLNEGVFEAGAWYSIRQTDFNPHQQGAALQRPPASLKEMLFGIRKQLGILGPEMTEEAAVQIQLIFPALASARFLVVIDNVETDTELQELELFLNRVDEGLPSKVVITTRVGIERLSNCRAFAVPLLELDRRQSIDLLRYQGSVRNLGSVVSADDSQLGKIFEIVGGNPLALNLALGLVRHMDLAAVIADLTSARGAKADALYHWIYWRLWHAVSKESQRTLFVMRQFGVDGANRARLERVSELTGRRLDEVIEELASMSLLMVVGPIDRRTYAIHRLTRTFLQEIVRRWDQEPGFAHFKEIDAAASKASLAYSRELLEKHTS